MVVGFDRAQVQYEYTMPPESKSLNGFYAGDYVEANTGIYDDLEAASGRRGTISEISGSYIFVQIGRCIVPFFPYELKHVN